MSDNEMRLTGTVTRDPELRYTNGGQAVTSLSVAHNQRYQDKTTKEWKEGEASFFDVTCWGALGENVAASITRGMRVCVTGRMQMQRWEDKEQKKRTSWKLIADEVAPSLKWATANVDRTVREEYARQATDEEYLPPEEPF